MSLSRQIKHQLSIPIASSILWLLTIPAQACLGPQLEYTIFFDRIPPKLKNETIAKVKIESIKKGVETARILQLFGTKNKAVKVGDRIILNYPISSCTRSSGGVNKTGIVVIRGFVNSDKERNLVAHIYQRRYEVDTLRTKATEILLSTN